MTTPSPTVIEEARKMAWRFRPEGYGPLDKPAWDEGRYDDNRYIRAFIAAIELGERRAAGEARVVEWLRDTNFGDDELDTTSLVFAGMIERGDHRSKPA